MKIGGSVKHGVTWYSSYALVRPDNVTCGFITNPDEDVMAYLRPCGRQATYEFQFKERQLDTWSAACEEHASVVRQAGVIARIASIRVGSELGSLTDEQRAWVAGNCH